MPKSLLLSLFFPSAFVCVLSRKIWYFTSKCAKKSLTVIRLRPGLSDTLHRFPDPWLDYKEKQQYMGVKDSDERME